MENKVHISQEQLTAWADTALHMNHLGTLVQRELAEGNNARAADLAERARKRAWVLLNELFESGAKKPENYCEPNRPPE